MTRGSFLRRWLAAVLALSPAGFSQDGLGARVDKYVDGLVAEDRFSGSVLLSRGGKILHSKAYGLADREHHAANATATLFRLGSITKQFTAVAILQLDGQGKLSLDDTAAKYVPESHADWKKVTIRHLLRHTSGIPSFTGFPEYRRFKLLPNSGDEMIARFKEKPLEFEPGTRYRYSNSGYYLLGYIVEKASGMNYEEYLRKNVFSAAGMNDSRADSNAAVIPRRAEGYTRSRAGVVENAGYIDMSVPGGAGNLISTVEDLYRWDRALYTGRVLPKPALDAMFTPGIENYGYGWVIERRNGRRVIGHGGGIDGFNTHIYRYPDDDAVVIALSNINTNMTEIARRLEALLFEPR